MSELGDRLRRHVEGASPAIDIQDVMVSRPPDRAWFRRVAAAAVVVAVAGTAVVVAERLSSDDPPAEVGSDQPIEQADRDDPWGWLDFGPESPDPPVPSGWNTLEYGPHRFSVPSDWIVPADSGCPSTATGLVLIAGVELTCDTPSPSAVLIDTEHEFAASGAESEQVRATLTDAGRVRVLQDGPKADTTDWQSVEYSGIEFLVPPSSPVVDLPGTYRVEESDDGGTSVSGRLNPGTCGGPWFTAGEVFLGETPLMPSCPRPAEYDLRPGLGVWVRGVHPNADLRYTTTAQGTVDGATVEIIEMAESSAHAEPLHVLITRNRQQTLLSLGIGVETATARSILHSISASPTADSSPPATVLEVADCVDVDRFAVRMGNLGIAYDYDPSVSPQDLRDSADAVIRATLLGVREDVDTDRSDSYVVFSARVDGVEKGVLETGDQVEVSVMFAPASVPFSTIEDHFTPGTDVVLFLDAGPWPGGWSPFLEGFWAGCDARSSSVLAHPVTWSHEGSLDHLLERTNGRIESEIGIDGAYRADDGTIVVTVTGYQWGYASCRGAYQATASAVGDQLTVSAIEILDGDRSGMCAEVGYTHVLGVAGTADIDANELVDAASGERVPIADGIDDIRPSFYRDRAQLPDCGFIDQRQRGDDEGAAAARECFREAYDSGDPAELGVLGYGEEGESAVEYFRIVDGETYEVLVEQRPPVDNRGERDGVWRWQRHECDLIHFLGPPDHLIADQPVLNYDGECRRVEGT